MKKFNEGTAYRLRRLFQTQMTRKTGYHLNARAPFGCQIQIQIQMTDFKAPV